MIGSRMIEIEIEGDIKELKIEIEWRYSSESNYGADADGNRGVYREWWEVVAIDFVNPKKSELTEAEIQSVYNSVDEMSASREV